ncbi:MAG: inositol monophosphatase family protein [Ilumatobacteraceae bacterium]
MHQTDLSDHSDSADVDDLRSLCIDLAVSAATRAAEGRAQRARLDAETKSSVTDLVTEFDRAAENYIRERLSSERPRDGVVGEEGVDVPNTSGLTWIVDPIDGTTNFVFGLPAWGCSIAVTRGDTILAGAVHLPALRETYSAALGKGASLNGNNLTSSQSTSLHTALVATGFAYDSQRRSQQGALVAKLLPQIRDIRRSGSAAYDLCCVAAGTVDAYYEHGLSIWDIAAGVLIAREAGAKVEFTPDSATTNITVVASASPIFESLRSAIAAG